MQKPKVTIVTNAVVNLIGVRLMRLIDADALISFIDPEHLRHSGELTFSEVDVINMLNHAPTAFDVDKVVEMLEEECFSPIDYPGYAVDIEKAIEIVEEGGKEC